MNLYPSSPDKVNPGYTRLPLSYNLKALLAILAILLFFVLYIVLVVSLFFMVKWAFTYPMIDINKLTILGKLGACLGSVMLFLFTLKFILKIKNHKPENRVLIKRDENKSLWSFVNKICEETGAPKPNKIFVDPDVNAYVSYSNSWLSLFLPVKKDLTIGLGLVSCLNLSEFKAVISHEFGHFAQRSMRIGSYIMSANTIIHDMIFNRDKWDQLLDEWRAMDFRVSFAAWIITPVVWLIRLILRGFYQALNIMYSLLSREMEFNADRVAAMTSGSDAIVSALWKLDQGAEDWNSSINHLYNANSKGLNIRNLYEHHTTLADQSKLNLDQKASELEDHPKGGKQYFISDQLSKVGMYASHPPNNSREENVKSPFIDCKVDDRSSWLLFEDKERIQESCTSIIYSNYLNTNVQEYSGISEFTNFVKNESKGEQLLKKYLNTYQNRYLETTEVEGNSYHEKNTNEILQLISELKKELILLQKELESIIEKIMALTKIAEGSQKGSVEFEEKIFTRKNLDEGFNSLYEAREKFINTKFLIWDKRNYSLHKVLNDRLKIIDDFAPLVQQHKVIVDAYKFLFDQKNRIINYLTGLQDKNQITTENIFSITRNVADIGREINKYIEGIKIEPFIPLSNIDTLEEFLQTIVKNVKIKPPYGNMFENNSYDQFIIDIDYSLSQLHRIDQKSTTEVLERYESIVDHIQRMNE